jgi:beta-galactosidase
MMHVAAVISLHGEASLTLLIFMSPKFPKFSPMLGLLAFCTSVEAAPLTVTVPAPPPARSEGFHMGTANNPAGETLVFDNRSLLLNGKPWTPVMGEFHYTRYPAAEWREELLKMKAGGISLVATYVFWIHHEEVEGEWNWSDRRNLHDFVKAAGDVGLKVIVRCGPWCHGEVRNGGLPDWLLAKGWKLRSEDPNFIGKTKLLYGEIAKQLNGLLWKDGGPVVGIQVDNEFDGPASYLLALKTIARDAGIDVPIYTRTGWPALRTPMPFGEIVPLYGAYAEGFWDRELTSMPGKYYWSAFRFSKLRVDDKIASEQLGDREAKDAPDVALYPYLTCEIGGGMMNSYHRRILIQPGDVESTMLIKLGSGSTLPGYYMYHGGTNPEGKLTTLMENQATEMTNWNDLPVMNYDFQGPLGEFGQIRPQYHLLRRVHLFLADFGAGLAGMPAVMPELRPGGRDDTSTLNWAVRSDGTRGYVFVNNYVRSQPMPEKSDVQFAINQPGETMVFPATPVTIPADSRIIWPFNFDLGGGLQLTYATAQPLCSVTDEAGGRTFFFGETARVAPQFAIKGESAPREIRVGRDVAFRLKDAEGHGVQVVVLSAADSLALWKQKWQGRDRVFLTTAGLVVDGEMLRLSSSRPAELNLAVYPAPAAPKGGKRDGIFTRYSVPAPKTVQPTATFTLQQKPGPAREIPLGKASTPVAAAPTDEDFAQAAVWRVELPKDLDFSTDPLLRIRYAGDVARIVLNGRMLTDDFYNGNVWEVGLKRYADEMKMRRELQILILPLRKDAVSGAKQRIFMAESAVPNFGAATSIAEIKSIEIVPRYQVTLPATKP